MKSNSNNVRCFFKKVNDKGFLNTIKYYLSKIKEKGLPYTFLFVIDSIWYMGYIRIYKWYLRHFTKINTQKVLFMSNPDFSDNAKVLYDYLYIHYPELQFVWLFSKENALPPNTDRTIFVHHNSKYHHGPSWEMCKQVMISKYVFFTHVSPMRHITKRAGQEIVNLWHGCGYKASQPRERSYITDHPFDYALVPGPLFVKPKKKFWGCEEKQILTIGYPRYDQMISDSESGKNFARQLKGSIQKLVLWMPTFRSTGKNLYPEDNIKGSYDIPLIRSFAEMVQLDSFCESVGVVLCIKRHMFQVKYSCEGYDFHNISFIDNNDLNDYDVDLYPILKYTDALISDYSSIAIDYLLLDKPIAFCLDDYEEYKSTRGFVFDNPLDYMPGNHLYNLEDLKAFIMDVCEGKDEYKTERAKVREAAQNPCDNYCKRIWDIVQKL